MALWGSATLTALLYGAFNQAEPRNSGASLSPRQREPRMLTIKTINKDNDISILQATGDVSFVRDSRMIFFRGWSGGDDEMILDDGEVAYVCNEKGVTVATFQ